MPSEPPRDRFWRWFRDNGDRLRDRMYGKTNAAREAAAAELREAGASVQPGLVLEIGGSRPGGPRELVVSADGRPERVDPVKDFVASAPALPGWNVTAFRTRMPISDTMEIGLGGETVGPGDIWFRVAADDDGLNLTLHVRGLTAANERVRGLGASLLAEHAVGERDVLTLVSSLRVAALPGDPAAAGLRPFRDLAGVFDEEKAKRYPRPGALPFDPEDGWVGMRGAVNGAEALILLNTGIRRFAGHPDYDRRLTITVPFNQAGANGMPATEKEHTTVQELGNRLGQALQEGQESLVALEMTSAGRRELVVYSADAEAAVRRVEALRARVETHRIEYAVAWDTFWRVYRNFCRAAEPKMSRG
jgi:hypothetical protein